MCTITEQKLNKKLLIIINKMTTAFVFSYEFLTAEIRVELKVNKIFKTKNVQWQYLKTKYYK